MAKHKILKISIVLIILCLTLPVISASIWDSYSLSKLKDTFVTYTNWKRNVDGSGYNLTADNFIGTFTGNSSIWSRSGTNVILSNTGDNVTIDTDTFTVDSTNNLVGIGGDLTVTGDVTADNFIGTHIGNNSIWSKIKNIILPTNLSNTVVIGQASSLNASEVTMDTTGLTTQTYNDPFGIEISVITPENEAVKNQSYLDGNMSNCPSDFTLSTVGTTTCESLTNYRLTDTREPLGGFDCATYYSIFMDDGCWNFGDYKNATLYLKEGLSTTDPQTKDLSVGTRTYDWNPTTCSENKTYHIYAVLKNDTGECKIKAETNFSSKTENYALALKVLQINKQPDIKAGDYVTLTYDGKSIDVTLPEITGNKTLYIANDGCTYNDLELTDLASTPKTFTVNGDASITNAYIVNKLGVGTTATNALDVLGNVTIDSDTLFVDSTGDKVCIGCVSPKEKLQVSGGHILLDNNQDIRWKNAAGDVKEVFTVNSNDDVVYKAVQGKDHIFQDSAANEIMRITDEGSTGNVGIGNKNPNATFDVSGDVKVRDNLNVTNGNFSIGNWKIVVNTTTIQVYVGDTREQVLDSDGTLRIKGDIITNDETI